jgi:hypothetical protein
MTSKHLIVVFERRVIMKRFLVISVFLVALLSILNINVTSSSPGEYPAIYVEPASIEDETLTAGENFTISIKTNCTYCNITAWQLTLSYNATVLKGVDVTNADLVSIDKSVYATFLAGTFNNTAGNLSLTGAFFFFIPGLDPPIVTCGPGTLANITFTVMDYGTSDIIIGNETQLIGWNFTGTKEFFIIDAEVDPEHIQHGYFSNVMPGDFDKDGDVDPDDFSVFAGAYGSNLGDPSYDPQCDLDDDGDVDPDDFSVFAGNYGWT